MKFKKGMKDLLTKTTVLVLNRNWQAIAVKTPLEAFSMIATGAATALDIEADGNIRPVTWKEWLGLPVREGDNAIGTVNGPVRVPSVLVLARYDRVPKKRPKFGVRAIWERDGGLCQYTGRKLRPHEGNIDHVVPLSRGGPTSWENCVLADKRVNSRKGSKLPEEAGLKLLRKPAVPRELPVTFAYLGAETILALGKRPRLASIGVQHQGTTTVSVSSFVPKFQLRSCA